MDRKKCKGNGKTCQGNGKTKQWEGRERTGWLFCPVQAQNTRDSRVKYGHDPPTHCMLHTTRHFSRLSLCSVCMCMVVRMAIRPSHSSQPTHSPSPLLRLHLLCSQSLYLWLCTVVGGLFFSPCMQSPSNALLLQSFPLSSFFFFPPFTFTAYKQTFLHFVARPIATYLGSCLLFINPSLTLFSFSSSSLSLLSHSLSSFFSSYLSFPFISHSSLTERYAEQSTSESGFWTFWPHGSFLSVGALNCSLVLPNISFYFHFSFMKVQRGYLPFIPFRPLAVHK